MVSMAACRKVGFESDHLGGVGGGGKVLGGTSLSYSDGEKAAALIPSEESHHRIKQLRNLPNWVTFLSK